MVLESMSFIAYPGFQSSSHGFRCLKYEFLSRHNQLVFRLVIVWRIIQVMTLSTQIFIKFRGLKHQFNSEAKWTQSTQRDLEQFRILNQMDRMDIIQCTAQILPNYQPWTKCVLQCFNKLLSWYQGVTVTL